MKKKVLINKSDKDVIDYPIAEAKRDKDDGVMYDPSTGQPLGTGDSYEWSIKADETVEFPEYVADHLLSIYAFLEEVGEVKEVKEEESKVKEVDSSEKATTPKKKGDFVCKTCGQEFTKGMTLGAHIGAKHPEVLGL